MAYWARLVLGLIAVVVSGLAKGLRRGGEDGLVGTVIVLVFAFGLILLVSAAVSWPRFRRRRSLQLRGLAFIADARVDLPTIQGFGADPDIEPRTYALCVDAHGITVWVAGDDAEPIARLSAARIVEVRVAGLEEPFRGAGQVHLVLDDDSTFAFEAVGDLLGIYPPSPAGTRRIVDKVRAALSA